MGSIASGAGFAARAAVGVVGLAVFVMVARTGRQLALTMVLVWLVLLGFIRRLLIPFAGWSNRDPLLLVSPIAALVLLALASRGDPPPKRNALSGIALCLLLLSVAEVINPNEHSVAVAVQALLFYFTPLAWFFVGTRLTTAEHDRAIDVLFWMTLPVVALGLYHSFIGLLPFEYHWLGVSHQSAAIYIVPFKPRPFSTLTSPQEYGVYLAFALIVMLARLYHRPRHPLLVSLLFGAATLALLLQSTRTIFIFFIASVAVVTVVRLRSGVALLLVFALIALVGLLTVHGGSGAAQTTTLKKHQSLPAALLSHEFQGLTHPGESTGPLHVTLIVEGFDEGLHHPFGLGISHGSVAAGKSAPTSPPTAQASSQDSSTGAENDVANTFAAGGIFGGLLLAALIVLGTVSAVRLYWLKPSARHLAWVGFCVAAFTQWLTGNAYATSTLLFLSLGGLASELTLADQSSPRRRVHHGVSV